MIFTSVLDFTRFFLSQHNHIINSKNNRIFIVSLPHPTSKDEANLFYDIPNANIDAIETMFFNFGYGDEIHFSRHYLLWLLYHNIISSDDVIIVKRSSKNFYNSIFKNAIYVDTIKDAHDIVANRELIHINFAQNILWMYINLKHIGKHDHIKLLYEFTKLTQICDHFHDLNPDFLKLIRCVTVPNTDNFFIKSFDKMKNIKILIIRKNDISPCKKYISEMDCIYIDDPNIIEQYVSPSTLIITRSDDLYHIVSNCTSEIIGECSGFLETMFYFNVKVHKLTVLFGEKTKYCMEIFKKFLNKNNIDGNELYHYHKYFVKGYTNDIDISHCNMP